MRNILLADSNLNNESLSINMLIRANYYWSIIHNQVIETKERPIALDTKIDWILSGPVNNHLLVQIIQHYYHTLWKFSMNLWTEIMFSKKT